MCTEEWWWRRTWRRFTGNFPISLHFSSRPKSLSIASPVILLPLRPMATSIETACQGEETFVRHLKSVSMQYYWLHLQNLSIILINNILSHLYISINHSFPCLPCLCKLQAKALCQSSPKGSNQLQQLLLHHLCLTGPLVPLSMQNWVPYPYLGIFCRVVAVSTSRSVYLTMTLVGAHLPTTPNAQPVENKD